MTDNRLLEAPLVPKGAILRPLDCRGPGSHDKLGYRCANYGIDGCLRFVCKRCAARSQPPKPYTEECNVCQIAVKNGCSIERALQIIAELHPSVVQRGKTGCASTNKGAPQCRKCVRHACKHCQTPFRSHAKASTYCGDICRAAASRETRRQAQERYRLKALAS